MSNRNNKSERANIHSQDYWEAAFAEFDEQLHPYRGMHAENMDFVTTTNLFSVMMQQVGHLALVTRKLALETAPKPRGRPPKATTASPQHPKRQEKPLIQEEGQEIAVQTTDGHVELFNRKLLPEQARDLGAKLLQAASELEEATPIEQEGAP